MTTRCRPATPVVLLPAGGRPAELARQPGIRPARPTDRPLLQAMHRRCGAASRYFRWHAPLPEIPEAYLAGALAGSAEHLALVAARPGEIVALASAARAPDGGYELGILVEDAWQRRGLGRQLLTALLRSLPPDTRLHADLLAERMALLRPLGRLGAVRVEPDGEGVHARIERHR